MTKRLLLLVTALFTLSYCQAPAPTPKKAAPAKKIAITPAPVQKVDPRPPANELTVEQVIQLVKAGLSEDLVIAKIKKDSKAFDLSAEQLLQLKKAGASDNIIRILMDPQAQPVAIPAPVLATVAPPVIPEEKAAPPAPVAEPPKVAESPKPEPMPPNPANQEDFKRMLKERYDGKVLAAAVSGLIAGEYKKAFLVGPGEASVLWHHYHESVPVPSRKRSNPLSLWGKKTSEMDQLDDRTFASLDKGLNISSLEKGEPLKVQKFYVMSDQIEFNLTTIRLGHLRDLDMQKASTETQTRVGGGEVKQTVSVGGFGLRFRFYFDKQNVLQAADYQTIVREINKYLLPMDEAEKLLSAERNVEIEIGTSEEAVIQKLGQPLKSLRVGNQKSLKYKDMTIILKDGKVAEVKLE